ALVHLALPWVVFALLHAIGYRADDSDLFRKLRTDRSQPPSPVLFGRNAPARYAAMSLPAAAWLAILLAIITAVAPSMFVPLTVGIIVGAVVMRSRAKVLWWTPHLLPLPCCQRWLATKPICVQFLPIQEH